MLHIINVCPKEFVSLNKIVLFLNNLGRDYHCEC